MPSPSQAFIFRNPTTINFGAGIASGAAELVAQLGGSKVLLVTDKALVEHKVVNPVLQSLTDAGFAPSVFEDVPPDSDLECVQKAVAYARRNDCDTVIAVGGGSVIDTAKVVNIGLCHEGDLREFEGINMLSSKLKPMILVPTTSGTGSEVSAVAMIKDRQTGKKLLYGSEFLFADFALLDPLLLLSLPPRLTAATGMDAVTHCLESYVSTTANPVSDSLALEAASLLFANLPRATKFGDDLEARASTLLASCMAGVAFTNAGVGIVHALAHTIGAKYDTHHGITNAVLLAPGMKFNLSSSTARYARFWRSLATAGVFNTGRFTVQGRVDLSDEEAADSLIEAVNELLKLCGLPARLRDIGVPELNEEALSELADIAMTDPAIMFNPAESTNDDLVQILREAF